MSLYFRWGGALIIMVGALLGGREYKQYLSRRISEYRGFLSLVAHAEGKITKYLSYGDGLWSDFSDEALTSCGFLPLLRGGDSVSDAFEKVKNKTALSKEAADFLSSAFKRMGQCYREGELKYLSELKEKLTEGLEKEREEAEKNQKVVGALLIGGALAVLIMVI